MSVRIVLSWLVFCLLTAANLASGLAADRPNILYVMADDWGYPHASIYGDKVVKTPNFDRVAQEGALFDNAFVSAPSCSPSRAAILTGQYHWRLGAGANLHGHVAAKYDVYPDLLEQAGYFVGFMKKGYGPGNNGDRPRNPCGPSFKGIDAFLKARPAGQPFCFWHGSHEPHRPYRWQAGVKEGMNLKNVEVPPYWPDNETTRTDICDYYSEVQENDRQLGDLLAALEKAGELDNTLIIVTGDHNSPFPRGKTNLYDSGTHVPLAIRWPKVVKPGRRISDFVSTTDFAPTILEAAGLKPTADMTGKSLLPILQADGSGQIDRARDHLLVGLERHVPCHLLENGIQGGYPARAIRTHDFMLIHNIHPERWPAGDPAAMDKPAEERPTEADLRRDTRLAFADCDASPIKAQILLNQDDPEMQKFYQLCFAKRPEWELYDLQKDPHEIHNVADVPAYSGQKEKLQQQLQAELKATADPRVVAPDAPPLDELPSTIDGKQPPAGSRLKK